MKSIEIPELCLQYQYEGRILQIDPIAANQKIDEILEARRGCRQYEHLQDFVDWIQSMTGETIPHRVADWMMDHIRCEVANQKKERLGWLNSALTIPGSTPADTTETP